MKRTVARTGDLAIDDLRARIHPDDRGRIAKETAAAFDDPTRASLRIRYRILRDDGSLHWLESQDKILRDGEGRALRTSGVTRAATGRKRDDQPPNRSWLRFEAALANTSVVVFQQDLSLRYTWMHNPKLGFEAQSVLGKSDSELTGPGLARPIDALKRRVLATGRSAREEVTMQVGGVQARYGLYVEPQRDSLGATIGVTGAAIEIAGERAAGTAAGTAA